jgi:hypothetical protein
MMVEDREICAVTMGLACSPDVRDKKYIQNFGRKTSWMTATWKRNRWGDNFEMDLGELNCEDGAISFDINFVVPFSSSTRK